jgi:DNA-binding FrmR family transcriptional regulator
MKQISNRLARVDGQLERLQQDIAAGSDCSEVIPQFLAVKGALDASFEAYVQESLGTCVAQGDTERLTQLVSRLIRK